MHKTLIFTVFYLLACLPAAAQAIVADGDSLIQTSGKNVARLEQTARKNYDSIKSLGRISRFKDSLKINAWSDSMRLKINHQFNSDSIGAVRKMDSLRQAGIPMQKYSRVTDSLRTRQTALLGEVSSKQKELHSTISKRYHSWEKAVSDRLNTDSLGLKIPGTRLPQNLPGTINDPLQKVLPDQSLSAPFSSMPQIPALNTQDFSKLNLSADLSRVGGKLSVPSIDQLQGWDRNLASVSPSLKALTGTTGAYSTMLKDPSASAEKAVGQMAEVNGLSKEISQSDQLIKQNEAMQVADKMKDPEAAVQEVPKMAVNHFQGQEAVLQKAMDQMARYKKKYSSLQDLSQVKKNDWLPHNGLKGMAFRERFRIGIHTGFRTVKDTLILDFFPNASYRISGRFEAGLGANYRVRTMTRDFGFDQHDPVWGLNTFLIFKTFKSTFLRVEMDGNSYTKQSTTDGAAYRDWRWVFWSGIQTNYKISKQWTGNVQMLYGFDKNLKDGFPERLTLRFGVQYKLKGR